MAGEKAAFAAETRILQGKGNRPSRPVPADR